MCPGPPYDRRPWWHHSKGIKNSINHHLLPPQITPPSRAYRRDQCATVAQLRTGHSPLLAGYLHRIGRRDSATCPHRNGADETAEHLVLHCSAHDQARRDIWLGGVFNTDPRRLWEFLERIGAVTRPLTGNERERAYLIPCDQMCLLRRVSMRTSAVPIIFSANLRISLTARGARLLNPLQHVSNSIQKHGGIDGSHDHILVTRYTNTMLQKIRQWSALLARNKPNVLLQSLLWEDLDIIVWSNCDKNGQFNKKAASVTKEVPFSATALPRMAYDSCTNYFQL